jgi:hypothetical protein
MVTTIGLVGHVAGLIGKHHWNRIFYDARAKSEGIYSSGKYWIEK